MIKSTKTLTVDQKEFLGQLIFDSRDQACYNCIHLIRYCYINEKKEVEYSCDLNSTCFATHRYKRDISDNITDHFTLHGEHYYNQKYEDADI